MTLLVALAGPSRSGKGTCAAVFAREAEKHGFTSLERQMSDNGKWSLARIFRPKISRAEAVAWFEDLKGRDVDVVITPKEGPLGVSVRGGWVPLQKFLQHGLQEGHRDIYGADFWTDLILPNLMRAEDDVIDSSPRWGSDGDVWLDGFFDREAAVEPTDIAIISDLRQPNEAQRVKDLGGFVIELDRPVIEDAYRTGASHITELALPRSVVDTTIRNRGDVATLEQVAVLIFERMILPRLKEES